MRQMKTDEEESNDHLDESDQEVLPDKSNASQSGSTDSELNEDSLYRYDFIIR